MAATAPVYLTGPTAVGKSAVALELARQLGGEIITVDSMQVYQGMDIGTAKPTPEERATIPHHLLDVVSLQESFDAARFVALARAAVDAVRRRARRPVFCGGTGFYFKAWLTGINPAAGTNPELRAELDQKPLPELLAELAARDLATWERIDRQNRRRVVRALEIIRLTGQAVGASQPDGSEQGASATPIFALEREPADLRRRVERRVDAMFAAGLVAETEALLRRGLADNRTAMQAIGYRQVVDHLQGRAGLTETIALVKQKTWQFVRRQRTWLRHQLPVVWVPVDEAESPAATAERIRSQLASAG